MTRSRRVLANALLVGLLTTILLVVPAGAAFVSGGKAPSDQPTYSYDSPSAATTSLTNTRIDRVGGQRTTTGLPRSLTSSIQAFRAAKGTRRQAFRRAKRASGIPTSQQPRAVTPAVDRRGNPMPGKHHTFDVPTDGGGTASQDILHHPGGHSFPDDPDNPIGPHFNDTNGGHHFYDD